MVVGPEEPSPQAWETSRLRQLGTGAADDRLGLRLVVRLLLRCVRLLQPVKKHIIRLVVGWTGTFLIGAPIGLLFIVVLWTRIFEGQPLTPQEAWFFGFERADVVDVPALSEEMRRAIRTRWLMLAAPLVVFFASLALGFYYYQIWILQRVNQVLRVELLDRFQTLSLRFHAESRVGDAIYRLYQDSAMVTQLIEVLFLQPIHILGRYVFCLVVVAIIQPAFALLLLVLWPPMLLAGYWFSQRLRTSFRAAREANSGLTSRIQEILSGIKVIKAYGAEHFEQSRFESDSRAAFSNAFTARSHFAVFKVLCFWLVGTAMVAGTAWGALYALGEEALFGSFVLGLLGYAAWNLGIYNWFKAQFGGGASSLRWLFGLWGRTQDVAIGLDRVFAILDLEPEVQDPEDPLPLPEVRHGIAFRGVHFRYQPDRPALEGVDLRAELGTVTAVVGPTGSGKSTLMALLLRLFDPSRGSIEIDGVDLRRFRVAELRTRVAIALQENLLFGATIRENIRYAVPEASDEAVREAARVACADEFIEPLPDGYDTELGERGTKLSTGQRQRLSIARAVLKDTPILILDEPTASLDAETELRVLRNLARWGQGRVIFLITHRLSTIRQADQVAVLEGGRVTESGSHAELLRIPAGAYRTLVESETGSAADSQTAAAS
ncbi:MAG: ABC transporter ATP-binding protein [Myxococcota bacterium]